MAEKTPKRARKRFQPTHFYAIVSVSIVLLLLGIGGILFLQANKLSRYFKENIEIAIILKESVNEAEIFQFQKMVEGEPFVKSSEYVSKETAAEQMQAELGEDFVDLLGYNPLFNALNIKLQAEFANPDSMAMLNSVITSYPQVQEIFIPESLIEQVTSRIKTATIIFAGIGLLMLIISIALVDNTLRLSMYSNRFLIRSMQLVGATRWFIVRPFVWKGIVNGFISSMLSIAVLVGLLYFVKSNFPGVFEQDDLVNFTAVAGCILLLGVFFSWISTQRAVSKYLKMKLDDLY